MNGKPIHYDGSVQPAENLNLDLMPNEPFELTDEMRNSIGGNPFSIENNK